MNPRIKELAEQCWDQRLYGKHFDQEMFAQLIVRECANRIDYWESRQGEHSDDLLKHFGIDNN
jgi:hypothetical protein